MHQHLAILILLLALAGCGTPAAPSASVPATAAGVSASTVTTEPDAAAQRATEEARLLTARATPTSVATQSTAPTSEITAPTAITLIDPQQPLASADDPAWQFQRSVTADFDGDGVEERAVLIARAEVVNGQPLWDDGQPWQVYVEELDGTRTYVYARFVQLGTLEAILPRAVQGQSSILLLEHTPFSLAVYEVRYRGPQQVAAVELVWRELDPARGFAGTPE